MAEPTRREILQRRASKSKIRARLSALVVLSALALIFGLGILPSVTRVTTGRVYPLLSILETSVHHLIERSEVSRAQGYKFPDYGGERERTRYGNHHWEWIYQKVEECGRSQGCGLLEEATNGYEYNRTKAVEYRGAPWRAHIGEWLITYDDSQTFPVQEMRYGKPCPESCRGHGNCQHEQGICHCESGWKGDGCEEDDLYRCNLEPGELRDFMENSKWVVSMCAATCDMRTGTCYCGKESKYPGRPAPEPVGFMKSDGSIDHNEVDLETIYGKNESSVGWCEADPRHPEKLSRQYDGICYYDGYWGDLCEIRTEQFCLNQCSLQGECKHGYCQCHAGWYGMDCSIPSTHVVTLKGSPVWPPKIPANPEPAPGASEPAADLEGGGGEMTAAVTVMRKRPLIYIYDLPNDFHVHHLQRRHFSDLCSTRFYTPDGRAEWRNWLYSSELMILEDLLHSEHRTTNPEEADYFFIPALGACMQVRADDQPRYRMKRKFWMRRTWFTAVQYQNVFKYIKSAHPYWNRTGGRDHIWTHVWDEGACATPKEIWNSIMLVHWGNTAKRPKSTSAYVYDQWNIVPTSFRGKRPCYDPDKDIILPAYKALNPFFFKAQTYSRPFEARPLLFYFNGNLGPKYNPGREEDEYSWGIRQKVGQYFASTHNVDGALGVDYADDVIVTHKPAPDYRDELASSRFCGVFPGDGWSGRMEDSILSGCIPVIIQDGIHLPYENFFDFGSIAVRIAEADIPRMIQILRAIPEDEVRAKLAAIQKIWPRFVYRGALQLESQRMRERGVPEDQPWETIPSLVKGDDAVQTLLQILHFKMYNDKWRIQLQSTARR